MRIMFISDIHGIKTNLELIKRLDKNEFNVTLITTECNINTLRQEFEKNVTVYDLYVKE